MFIEQQFFSPEKKEKNFQEFLELPSEEKTELKNRIEKWNGLVRIFVHPMFEKWRGIKNRENKKIEKIIGVVAKLSSMEEEETPPIIMMEEASHIDELKSWLEQGIQDEFNLETHNKIYLINTQEGSSDPLIKESSLTTSQSWEKVREELESLGVKKILIGGMQLTFSESERGNYYHRCLGIAITELSEDANGDFEIELSNLSYPEGRAEQRELKDKKPRV